jgi:hypothetical protein
MGRAAVDDGSVENVTEAELNDLRQKFHLLEGDRKAYYEMSMQTMKENKRVIAGLRDSNKELRTKLAGVQRQARAQPVLKGTAADASEGGATSKDVKELEKHVLTLRKNHDTLKAMVEARRGELRVLRDEASALELDVRRPSADDSPLTRKIRALENRLDKAMIKYNEAQSIRKTYEQIVKRLREERVGFDNQLAAVERTLSAKQHDLDELLLLSGDAAHAKDVAGAELDKQRALIAEARKSREREVRAKREIVSARSEIVTRLEKREQLRNDIMAKANGDLGEAEEGKLKASVAVNLVTQTKVAGESTAQRTKIDVFEDAFRKIKDATGVSDVNEVIQKIVSQEDTQRNLRDLTRENQDKLEQLQADKTKLQGRVEEIKYSGSGGGHRRKMVDDYEENLAGAVARLERSRLRYERLAKILINVKAGIAHLADKLETVQSDNKHIVMNDDTVVDVLVACENTLSGILTKVRVDNDVDQQLARIDLKNAMLVSFEDDEVVASRPYNQRVSLPDADAERGNGMLAIEDGDARMHDDDMDAAVDEDGEEELTRDRIKKASQTIIQTHEKKVRKGRKAETQSQASSSAKQDAGGANINAGSAAKKNASGLASPAAGQPLGASSLASTSVSGAKKAAKTGPKVTIKSSK